MVHLRGLEAPLIVWTVEPIASKTTYLQGAVLASCQPKLQDVPGFLFRHSTCLH